MTSFPRVSRPFWAAVWLLLAAVVPASAQVVINEIYYDPADGVGSEFIELYNWTGSSVDLTGWKFDAGVDFTFPANSSIAANGYVVLAQDAASFQSAFGFAPAGVFAGKLSNSGEQLRLRNAANTTIDSVTYGVGFPWPTAARGEGSSLELINPNLDNAQPGAWRSSGQPSSTREPQVYVPPIDSSWHWRKGTSEASSPVDAWRNLSFVEDGSWQVDQTSIGYGDSDDNTELTDMQNIYSSLYLRRHFNIPTGAVPNSLVLKVRVDDGCVVWINGTEVGRFHVPTGSLAYNSFATDHEASISAFESLTITNASAFLHAGDNVIAIHALNATLSSSDFSIDAQLIENVANATTLPTPGAINSTFAANPPPFVDTVAHSPNQPTAGQVVTVTAHVADADGLSAVALAYQTVDPGGYIRKTDASYSTAWTNIAMHDDGLNGDAVSGDGTYTAQLPGSLQTHRRLVRYRITATDAGARSIQVPYGDDGAANFAYFCYNGVPSWTGSFDPSTVAAQTFPGSLMGSLPTYQLIAQSADVTNSQYVSSYNGTRMLGTLVYNGTVYDHITFNNRGEASTYKSGKNKWRIHFNTAHDLQAVDNWNHPFAEKWDELNLNACASPWCPQNRGMAGLDEAISFRFQALAGVPSPSTSYLHFRVISETSETSAPGQFNAGDPSGSAGGDLWGIYMAVEQPDGSFLDERGLADGNVYKIESSLGDQKHQGDGQATDGSDWTTFLANCKLTQTEAWWRANLDLNAYYNFHAANRILANIDLREGFNHCFYHNPDGHWAVIPWDMDMMFVPRAHQPSNWSSKVYTDWATIDQRRCLTVPTLAIEFKNRGREILDLLCADATVAGGQWGQLVDEYTQMVNPTGQAQTWADVDAAMWNMNPRSSTAAPAHFGNFYKTPLTGSWRGGSWTRTLATADHEGQVKFLMDFATNTFGSGTWVGNNGNPLGYGYKYLEAESADTAIPNRPTATYAGPSGYPLNNLLFNTTAYSGGNAFSAVQWRIGEISAPTIPLYDSTKPRIYEVTDIWRSAELASTSAVHIPANGLQTGHTYRVRVRHKDTTGRYSRWSSAVQFVAGAADATPYQQNLIVSEIMYNPGALTPAESTAGFTDKQDFEYIALKNIGTDPLDLSGVGFTVGITYSFPAGTTLAAGGTILVAKSVSAFNLRYGAGKPVLGDYGGNLSNSGETLTLSFGSNLTILSFAYGIATPWPAEPNGAGYSLVLVNQKAMPNHALAANWRGSRKLNGSPGTDDTVTYAAWAAAYPSAGAMTNNPDGDAGNNLAEYAEGTNPVQNSTPTRMTQTQTFSVNSVSAPYLTFSFRRQVGASDLTYHVEFSTTLSAWTEDGLRVSSTPNGDGTATEVWRAAQPTTAQNSQFVRLRVTNP